MKIFVTGHRGYIGTHLISLLKEEGHFVAGCDLNLFNGCHWETLPAVDREFQCDIRELTEKNFETYDCVIHLAAISNDPMGDFDTEFTKGVNLYGSIQVAKKAKLAGVPRFLFAGSCSVYGKGESLDLDENASFNPISVYAMSKIEAEKEISLLADSSFCPAFLRNSTAYGHSPMLRIDLVANNLLACAFTRGDIRIMSDGTPWRPLIHCKDIARAFISFAKAPTNKIFNKAVNIGSNFENYQFKDVADKVKELIPKANIVFTGEVGSDPRDYRVNFNLLGELLPEFKLEYDLDTGLEELYKKFVDHKFSLEDFDGDKFVRLRTLKKVLSL